MQVAVSVQAGTPLKEVPEFKSSNEFRQFVMELVHRSLKMNQLAKAEIAQLGQLYLPKMARPAVSITKKILKWLGILEK